MSRLTGVFAAMSLWFGALLPANAAVGSASVPDVVVSIRPLHALVAGLMQGVAEPRLLIDGDVAPWAYVPDGADRAAIAAADLLIHSGTELEPGLVAVADAAAHDYEVLSRDVLKILPAPDDDEKRDPFYWLDSRNMLILLDEFAQVLIDMDPQRAMAYERNWQRMNSALSAIDRVMEYSYRDVSGVPVFFYHDTHRYFAQAYAMHVGGAVAAAGGGADPQRLLQARLDLQRAGDACLFTEKGLDQPHLDLLRTGPGIRTVELDSFGIGLEAGPDLYVQLMRDNFDAISGCVRALRPGANTVVTADGPTDPGPLKPRYLMRDQFGRAVSNEDFDGRLQLIYFGYTFCPDVCPTSLAIMVQALKLLSEEEAAQVQPIFITVDPERDTPQVLKEYLAWFDPRLLGLSASPEVTQRTADLFRARYARVPAESGDPRRYTMDHSASLFLLGRDSEFITKFAHGLPARDVAERLRGYLRE